MDAPPLALLRPARRTRQRVIALVTVALVGWLGLTAGHLHLDAPDGSPTLAHVGGCHGHVHCHGEGSADDTTAGHERPHTCAVCLALERGAGPAASRAPAVALAPRRDVPPGALRLVPSAAPGTPYRSRAPPLA